MAVKISNCGSDSRGKYSGDAAGDQTGTEWRVRDWWNAGWVEVLRHPDANVRAKLAELATAAANNNRIGYDQSQRLTFYEKLKAAGWNPASIAENCEADCSSGVAAIVIAVGHLLNKQLLRGVNPSIYTGNQSAALRNAGFERLTGAEYTQSTANLRVGDILLSGGHTTIVVSGAAACSSPVSGVLSVDGYWGVLTTRKAQKRFGTVMDGIVSGQDWDDFQSVNGGGLETASWKTGKGGSQLVRAIQRELGVTADGCFGPVTCKAFQKRWGTVADGVISGPSDAVKGFQRWLNAA